MRIRSLLKQAGISEPAYYSLMRQEALPFMRMRRRGHRMFRMEHLLAMKAFGLLRSHGVGSKVAGLAVKAAFQAICDFANEGELESPTSYKLGARLFTLRGKLQSTPLHHAAPPGSKEVGCVEFDLRGIAALIPSPAPPADTEAVA